MLATWCIRSIFGHSSDHSAGVTVAGITLMMAILGVMLPSKVDLLVVQVPQMEWIVASHPVDIRSQFAKCADFVRGLERKLWPYTSCGPSYGDKGTML